LKKPIGPAHKSFIDINVLLENLHFFQNVPLWRASLMKKPTTRRALVPSIQIWDIYFVIFHTSPQYSKQLYLNFCKIRTSPGVAIDQPHGQTNVNVKGDDDSVGIKEESSALIRRIVAGAEVTHLVNHYT
jgi:hypothetical protein